MNLRNLFVSATLAVPVIAAAALSAAPASADIVLMTPNFGGPWVESVFEPDGQAWDDQFQFHLSAPGLLQVTDGYQQGDIFDVVANGVDLGHTSDVPPDPNVNYWNNFDNAFNSTIMSHGQWALEPGDYTITGSTVATPFGFPGGFGIRVESLIKLPIDPTDPTDPTGPTGPTGPMPGVPEPASWALMILGLGSLGASLRQSRARRCQTA